MESGDFPVPILFLKFGKNTGDVAYDSSPEENDGDLKGPTWTTGFRGPGLLFDGLDDYVTLGDVLDLNYPFSLVAWFKSSDVTSSWGVIMRKYQEGPNYYGFILTFYATGGKITFIVNGSALTEALIQSDTLSDDTWYHVVATYDGETINLYINGSAAATPVSASGDIDGWGSAFEIGRRLSTPVFKGVIDEVRVYDVALTARQVRELYYGIE